MCFSNCYKEEMAIVCVLLIVNAAAISVVAMGYSTMRPHKKTATLSNYHLQPKKQNKKRTVQVKEKLKTFYTSFLKKNETDNATIEFR